MRKLAKKILSICLIAIISIVNVAVFPVKAENDLIFDDDSQIQNCSEKTKLILKYVINYLCYKISKDKYYCFNNPIIRLPDNKNVDNEYIHAIRCIKDAKEIFKC